MVSFRLESRINWVMYPLCHFIYGYKHFKSYPFYLSPKIMRLPPVNINFVFCFITIAFTYSVYYLRLEFGICGAHLDERNKLD